MFSAKITSLRYSRTNYHQIHELLEQYETVLRFLAEVSNSLAITRRRKWGFLGMLLNCKGQAVHSLLQ